MSKTTALLGTVAAIKPVMHVDDESFGESEVVEVLQKGYICGDKVIRYAMVKVAN